MRALIPFLILILSASVQSAERPNVLWITAEDMSPSLGCYGDAYARTPNIDRFASQSVRYTRAFATAPVCSPARSCLITGCYAPSLGTQQMRSAFPIPKGMRGFPALLRQAGYYTSNNVKTDYNTSDWEQIVAASWNDSSVRAHFRNRPVDSPFFSVFNLMTSHQSRTMVWPYGRFQAEVQSRLAPGEIHDPAAAPLPPYYPDTPVIRRTVARFHDCVTAMDKEVGAILDQLEDDGLADRTIVFLFSDHGSGLPRHKRALFDSGMRVPLLIRFPEKFRNLAPAAPGSTTSRLVSFVDFAPTVLALAGLPTPGVMQGTSFAGLTRSQERDYVHGHRDRVDEVRDLARSVRDERFLYIRNYHPYLGYNQPTGWPDLGEIRHEFYRLTDRDRMSPAQWQFAGPSRPAEELYDTLLDPDNLENLANNPAFRDELTRFRDELRRHLSTTRDFGFVPESEAWRLIGDETPWEVVREGGIELDRIRAAADMVGMAEEPAFLRNLADRDACVRYWGVIGLAAQSRQSAAAVSALREALRDRSSAVRIESAKLLVRAGDPAALDGLLAEFESSDLNSVLHAMRTVELLGNQARSAHPAVQRLLARCNRISPPELPPTTVLSGDQDLAMFTRLSIGGFLERVKAGEGRLLFDGRSIDGWEARANGQVEVVEGEIRLLSQGPNLWLVHDSDLEDFELTVEAKMPPGEYNSGIGFRCVGSGRPRGYQCEVAEEKSGMIYAIGSGWVWPRGSDQEASFREISRGAFRSGEWNRFRIRCEGDHVQVWINGIKTTDVRDGRYTRGGIALQHHGKGGVHRFRDVVVQPL